MNPPQRPPNQGTPGQQPGHPGQGPRPQIGQQAGQPPMNGMPPMISYSVRGQSGFQGGMSPHMNPPTSIQGGNFPPNQMGHHGNYPRPQMAYQQIRPPIFQTTATTGIPTQQRFITSQQSLRPPHFQSGNQPQIRQQSPYGQGGFPASGGQQFHPYNPRMPYNNRFPVNTQFGFNQQPYANQIPTQMNFPHQRPQQPNQPNVGGPGQIPGSGHITNVNGQPPNQINPNAPVFHPTGDEYAPRPHVNPSPTFNPGFQAQQSQNVPKKKSRAMLIVDPETGKPIDMDEDTPRSRQQSESQKSDKGSSEVAVEKETTTPVTEEVVKEVPVKEVVKEEPEQPAVQEQSTQEQDDGGWEAVPTKPKKGGKKTNQKNESNKGQGQQKGKDVKSKKVEVENKEVQEVVEKVKELKVEETKAESPVEKVPVEEPKKESKVEAAVETPVEVKTPEPKVEEVKKPEVETEKVEPEVQSDKNEPTEPTSPTEEKTEETAEVKVEESTEDVPEVEEGEKTATPDPTEEAESTDDHQSLALANREKIEKGEKVAYDRDFLLKFQSACLDKPAELPDLEVILVAPTDAHRRAPAHERPQTNFQPHYIQGGRGGRGGRQGSRQGDRRGSRNPNTMTIKLPSTQKKLNELPAEMKFKPGIKEDLSADEKAKQQFQREAKNILNKLTPENETRLTAKFVALQPKSLELLNVVVSTLFEKAICEPHFAKQYAKLCKACHEKWEKKYKFEVIDPRKPNEKKKKAFREVLLTKAQEKFEKLKILHVRDKELFEEKSIERKRIEIEEKLANLPKEGEEGYDKKQDMELSEELQDLNARIKVQSMGNVTFVGELYLEKLLSVNIMIGCMRQLINSEHETELESLSKLIPTIGKELENEQRGQEEPKKKDFIRQNLNRVFQQIDQVIENRKTLGNDPKPVSPRVICLLQDIVDLKKRNWQLRATQQGKGPAKLDQLHNEHHRAEAEKQAELTNKIAHENRRRTQENRAKSERFNTGQWTTTHGQPITKPRFDPTSLASSKNRSNDTGDQPQRLGPARGPRGITKGRSNDSRSTDTAPNSRSQTPDIAPNKFALLDDDGDMDTLKSMPRSQSFNRDRRASEAPQQGRNNDRHRMTKHMTHDGRTHERKKLTLEELEKKTRTVLNDWQEANGEVKLLEEVCDDILKYGLLETPDHQKLMIKQMIDHVLEKNEESRLAMGKFFHIMADKLSGLHFEEPLKSYIDCVIDEDFLTDCPKFWEFFCMIIAPIFRSRNTNAKIVNNIFEKASEAMAMTKGLCTLLQELSYVFGTKNKEALHEFFTASGIDIGESMKKDEMEGETPKERLGRIGRHGLDWLLEPLVRVNWSEVERGLTEILQKHDFTTDTSANDFNKEFDFLEEKVPLGPDGRENLFFTQVVVTAVMNYSVIRESDNWKLKESGDDVALADCGLLLQKYLDDSNRQIDALFILADLFNRYENNQVVVNETFRALYEISVIEISTFEQWKGLEQATKLKNYPLIITATTKFYEALEEEKKGQASA